MARFCYQALKTSHLFMVVLFAGVALMGCAAPKLKQVATLTNTQSKELARSKGLGEQMYAQSRENFIARALVDPRGELEAKQVEFLAIEKSVNAAALVLVIEKRGDVSRVVKEVIFPVDLNFDECVGLHSDVGTCDGVKTRSVDRALTASEQLRYSVFLLLKAASLEIKRCTQLPAEYVLLKQNANWLGYVISARDDFDTVILAGHTRVRISADGRSVLKVEPIFKSCSVLSAKKDLIGPDQYEKLERPEMVSAGTPTAELVHEGLVFAALDNNFGLLVNGTAAKTISITVKGQWATVKPIVSVFYKRNE